MHYYFSTSENKLLRPREKEAGTSSKQMALSFEGEGVCVASVYYLKKSGRYLRGEGPRLL